MKRIVFRCKNCGKIVEEIFPSQYSLMKRDVEKENFEELHCGCIPQKEMVRFEIDKEKTTEDIIIDFYKKERSGEV